MMDGCAPTCPQVEGEPRFNEVWGVALGAESPDRSAVFAAVRSGRHQFEPASGGMTADRLGQTQELGHSH